MAEKFGNWFISAMPITALNSAIDNTKVRLERARDRMKDLEHQRYKEFEKSQAVLSDLVESLERARRNG